MKKGKTHKNIHEHVLQRHLQVLESGCKSHRSDDPKSATENNQFSILTQLLTLQTFPLPSFSIGVTTMGHR